MESNTKKYQTFCPLFPGFYNTVFEYSNEEEDINYYNEENGTNLNWDDFNWDYKEYEERVSQAFVNELEREMKDLLPIKIEYESLYSPREYNFTNDSINITVEVDLKQLTGLIKERSEEAAKYFKDKYTSCSGFISFHSPYLEDWLNESYILEKENHRVGALLDCLASLEIDQDKYMYWADSESWCDSWPKDESLTK